jgi:hypothetical protein
MLKLHSEWTWKIAMLFSCAILPESKLMLIWLPAAWTSRFAN